MLDKIIAEISNALYSYILIIILVVGGIYFTIKTKVPQATMLKEQIKVVSEKPKDKKQFRLFTH